MLLVNKKSDYSVPILFNIFNRPKETKNVFNIIRKIRPYYLYIKADGPRLDKPEDVVNCTKTRALVNKIDWDCEIHTLFFNRNLGCKHAISSGIDWFFSKVEEGIILEDDCLPDLSFFYFCKELLERYREDERIMMISGDNFQCGQKRGNASYYFSRYAHVWGWATWRRAWKLFDVGIKTFPEFKSENRIADIFDNKKEQEFWMQNFHKVYDEQFDTWDYQWVYTLFSNNGLSIMPNINLVSNIGFNSNATHTKDQKSRSSSLQTHSIKSLVHPKIILADKVADEYTAQNEFGIN